MGKLSHIIAMVLMAVSAGIIFSYSMRETWRERVRFSLMTAGILVGLALLVGWLMVPFPR